MAALKKSVKVINQNVLDPISFPNKKLLKNKIKIKKNSLRGGNCFVQMAVCKITDPNNVEVLEQYAYQADDLEQNITYSIDPILGYGDSQQNLLTFMIKKHHNIIKNTKKSYKDSYTLNLARDPETPIYLSYTPQDLEKVASQPHEYAIYYGIGIKQPIGAISIQKIK